MRIEEKMGKPAQAPFVRRRVNDIHSQLIDSSRVRDLARLIMWAWVDLHYTFTGHLAWELPLERVAPPAELRRAASHVQL